ncbi:DUF4097 family beta strand repeat-containing protein [Thalassotalea profundi]|uniref:Adhesin domain-containing protein n=1 Tax=Thalassotalea profundi TaxID=2036687 RepID=A0ABQ3ICZ2_9GAMM|nr:DUF4097 family beta strand repeat-containing protein [Thalassotalea profundi]GHE78945.1 hypothetical protein GCM10011501_03560 [Thalassotalea profundi]
MKSLKNLSMAIATAMISLSAIADWNDELTLQDTKTMSLNATDLSSLQLNIGAGSLTLNGSNSDKIQVNAKIYQARAHSEYRLALTKKENTAQLIADNDDSDMRTQIDLEVRLPSHLYVKIDDGSGSMSLSNIASADIIDGSGSITVNDITGDLTIDDGSGSITITNIAGDLTINDGSGSINAEKLKGSVKIKDGSGDITINNAEQGVTISDGSGSITVDHAASFTLLSDGSGGVKVSNISGAVKMND